MKIHLPEVCWLTISDSGILIAIFKAKFQLVSGSFGTPVIIYSDTFVFLRKNKKPDSIWNQDFLWCHQESNRGHKDFQSFALPTELWHHFAMGLYRCFSITGANVEFFYLPAKCLDNYFSNYFIHFLLIADFQRIVLHVYLHSRQCLIASIDTLIS